MIRAFTRSIPRHARLLQKQARYHATLASGFGQSVLLRRTAVLFGGLACTAAFFASQGAKSSGKHRNDSPEGPFATATKDYRIASKPSKDKEWSSYVPDWSRLSDHITDVVVPSWANAIPGFVDKLQSELTAAKGTLAYEMWEDACNANVNPEIAREASVRISGDLCAEEQSFLEKRKHHTRKALARYLDLTEEDVHADDVPTIAMCGSGGGLRAMVAGASSYYSAQKAGLFDCVTYTAGVSGSCWLQSLFYSSITGQKLDRLLEHLKNRLGVHIAFPPDLLKLVTGAPTNKFLLCGAYEKYRGFENADFGLVDAYGLMLGARLLVPKGELAIDDSNLKLSNQKQYVDGGAYPLPIYTAVRHEIPPEKEIEGKSAEEKKAKAKDEAWFQWFEFTPYELFCEELGAGIPTWSVGRDFKDGHNIWRENGLALPEIRVPLLMGVFGSAFCATLSHYYKEVRPLIMGLTGFSGLDEMISQKDEDLVKMHPIDPAQFPNYAQGLKHRLPETCPESVDSSPTIQLMDAGMSNNLPIYPLLRPGRNVDIIVAFDASADIKQDNWLRVADGYAKQRGIKGWPVGTGWPDDDDDASTAERTGRALDEADNAAEPQASAKLDEAAHDQSRGEAEKMAQGDGAPNRNADSKDDSHSPPSDLGYCNIWVGSTTEHSSSSSEPPQSRLVSSDRQLMTPDAGIAVIYFPFMANAKVEGVDPRTSEYMSTWNFVYTPEQVDKVTELAERNFAEGEEQVKMCIRAVYERKKKQRMERERVEREKGQWWSFGLGG